MKNVSLLSIMFLNEETLRQLYANMLSVLNFNSKSLIKKYCIRMLFLFFI